MDTGGDYLRLRGIYEDTHERCGEYEYCGGYYEAENAAHNESGFGAAAYSLLLTCTEVLRDEG